MEQFDDPAGIDKLSLTNAKVDEVKIKLNDNLNSLMHNQADIDKMEAGSNQLRETAGQFEKQAGDVKRIMYIRNLKMNICIGIIVLCVIIIIIMLFVKT